MAISIRDQNEGEEQPGLEAGVIEAAKDLMTVAPRLLAFQRALSGGIASTQEREARRLAKKYGGEHPRVVAARSRAAALSAQGSHIDSGVDQLGKAIEPLFTQNMLAGYVVDSKGTPAASHTVRLQLRGEKGQAPCGKTGKDGYFRIALGGSKSPGRDPVKGLAANLARFMPSAAGSAGKANTASETADKPQLREYDVSILDPAGQVVHEEDLPLPINMGQSSFRYFVLSGKAPPPVTRPQPAPKAA